MTESTVQDVMPPDVQTNDTAPTQAFSFGDPIPVLERRKLLDYVAYVQMDKWYEPPMSWYLATPTWKSVLTGSVECCHWSRPWRNTRGAELSSTPIGSCNTV